VSYFLTPVQLDICIPMYVGLHRWIAPYYVFKFKQNLKIFVLLLIAHCFQVLSTSINALLETSYMVLHFLTLQEFPKITGIMKIKYEGIKVTNVCPRL